MCQDFEKLGNAASFKWTSVFVAILSLVVAQSARAEEPRPAVFSNLGFSIDVLDITPPKDTPIYESLRMLLPAEDGFASNIGIQYQTFPGTLQEYAELSEKDVKKSNFTLLHSKAKEGAYYCELAYTLKVNEKEYEMRCHMKAIKADGNIILATITAPATRWEKDSKLLQPILNSLTALKKEAGEKAP